METSFGLLFYLKKRTDVTNEEIPVYLRITVDGIAREVSIKRSCAPGKWATAAGKMSGKTQEAADFNRYLDTLRQKVFEAKRKLIELDKPVTAEVLKQMLTGKETQKKYMVMEIFRHHNEQMKALEGKEFAVGTVERYETSFRHTQEFLQWKYKVADLELKNLDYDFVADYLFWLKSERHCNHNSAIKYISNFRKIVNTCLRKGWLAADPFIAFKMTKKEVERVALTPAELKKLASKAFPTERLEAVRDIFLFSCFSGLAYADVKKLKRAEIGIGIDGEQWIVTKRQKTDTGSRIPLLPSAILILDKYAADCSTRNDCALPVLTNQKMNAYLKEIADLCGVRKNLTFHIARHTFATTVTLSNGVPMETVSKMLGHKNLRTTQHYAKILDIKISEDMKAVRKMYVS